MNLNPIYELRERLAASAVSGVGLIMEDFRLTRVIEQASALSEASPVFQKIDQMAKNLISPECQDKCNILLDTLALLDAVLCTQALMDTEEERKPIPVFKGMVYANVPYSALAPLLTALESTGGGRYNIIHDIIQEQPQLMRDYRLKTTLVHALGDSYSEIGDMIEQWMRQEGESFLPYLKQNFDPKGKKEMVRRVHVIEAISGVNENDFYKYLLEHAEKEVRSAAILALRHSKDNESLLLNLIKTEKGNMKKAAQLALTTMESPETLKYWIAFIKKSPEAAASFLYNSTNSTIADYIAETFNDLLDSLLSKTNRELEESEYYKLLSLVKLMTAKSSPAISALYKRFMEDLAQLCKFKWKGKSVNFYDGTNRSDFNMSKMPSSILINSIILSCNTDLTALAKELYLCYPKSDYIEPAFLSSLIEGEKEQVYDQFADKITRLFPIFSLIRYDHDTDRYVIYNSYYNEYLSEYETKSINLTNGLDPRWFLALINCGKSDSKDNEKISIKLDHILTQLLNPKDPYCCNILGDYFLKRSRLTKKRDFFYLLKMCKQKNCTGLACEQLRALKQFSAYNILMAIEDLPLTDEEKLKELALISELVSERPNLDTVKIQKQIQLWSENIRDGSHELYVKNTAQE